MTYVFDACAIIAYLRGEKGSDVIETYLLNSSNKCMIHAINLCEVYYDLLRVENETIANEAIDDVKRCGIITCEDLDEGLWREAGKIKATGRISLADCFAIALAKRMNAQLLTSDHSEFDRIANDGICNISFFR